MLYTLLFVVLALGHFTVSCMVTAHVLLTRRDVRAAIGWIGIAWLSPALGPMLYYAMGINRVSRRASRLRRRHPPRRSVTRPASPSSDAAEMPPHIVAIARVGTHVARRPLTPGNAIEMLQRGDAAYPAMLRAIAQARHSIAMSYYIFEDDAVGRQFIDALVAARARGVEIRVLLDGIGAGYLRCPAGNRLVASGIRTARFMHHWLPWRMPFLNMRNHKKIVVVDGALGFTGGMNISIDNMWSTHPRKPVEDVHFAVRGPVVGQLLQSFAEDWHFTTGEALEGRPWWPELPPAGPVAARGISSGPDEDLGKIEAVLAAAVGQAQHRIRIVTPYFLPDEHLLFGIVLATQRGVRVEVVLPERTDHRLMDWAIRAHLRFAAEDGIRVYFTPAPFDHSKLVTVDGAWGAVGSVNWDVRSLRLSFEFMLECYDQGLVESLDQLIDGKLATARRYAPRQLTAPRLASRLRDAAARLLLPYL